jgi:hypothetical protein
MGVAASNLSDFGRREVIVSDVGVALYLANMLVDFAGHRPQE